MNLEKIKEIWEDKKKIIIGVGILIIGCLFYFYSSKSSEVDNSNVLNNQNIENSESSFSTSSSSQLENKPSKVTVDISGAVKHGGVYTLKQGARLNDLLESAGGLTERAEIKAINRAQILKDQDQIYVPYKGEKVDLPTNTANNSSSSTSSSSGSQAANGEQVHLNSATVADLQKLPGVGEKKAEQIIQFRDQNGGFKQIEDLTKVSGIGEKTFEKLKDQLAL